MADDIATRSLQSIMLQARSNPRLFADLLNASTGRQSSPHDLHALIQDFLDACLAAKKKCVIQAPPEHGKTTQIIPRLIHYLANDPTRKVGIVSKDADLASEHLTRIRKALLSPVCRSVFPELAPDFKASAASRGARGEWSKVKLYLANQTQPAFETYSLTGAAEGHRLDMIWLDDCVTRDCLHSEAARKATAAAIFETFGQRLTDEGLLIVTNNCWHKEDAIHQMMASPVYATLWIGYVDTTEMYFRIHNPPETWAGAVEGTMPLWQEQWPEDRLVKKTLEPGGVWKRLYQGKAIAPEECRFPSPETWGRWNWAELDKSWKLFAFLDPAGGKRADKGDYAAIVVVLRRPDATLDVVDCWVDRLPPERQVAACFALHEKWSRLGFGGLFEIEVEMLPKEELWVREQFRAAVERRKAAGDPFWQLNWKVNHPVENKAARIERLGPPIENGWLRFPEDLEERTRESDHWRRLVEQIEEWPFADHDDAPDATAGATVLAGRRAGSEKTGAPFAGVGVFG